MICVIANARFHDLFPEEMLSNKKKGSHLCEPLISMAPGERFELPTKWLTATRSAS